jgi:hypothetical protein
MTEDNTPTTWSDLTSARFGSEADAGTDWRGSSSVTAFGQERTSAICSWDNSLGQADCLQLTLQCFSVGCRYAERIAQTIEKRPLPYGDVSVRQGL